MHTHAPNRLQGGGTLRTRGGARLAMQLDQGFVAAGGLFDRGGACGRHHPQQQAVRQKY